MTDRGADPSDLVDRLRADRARRSVPVPTPEWFDELLAAARPAAATPSVLRAAVVCALLATCCIATWWWSRPLAPSPASRGAVAVAQSLVQGVARYLQR